jgi:pimeloyl-[acyl-carrier protein] synthase
MSSQIGHHALRFMAVPELNISMASGPGESGVVRFRLTSPDMLADPYPTYRRMQVDYPVYKERHFGWVLTRYADISAALRGSHSAHRPRADEAVPQALRAIEAQVRSQRAFQSLWMLYSDPPQHTRLRALVTAAFTPRIVERLRPTIQRMVDEMLDAVERAGRMDVVADLAYPLPTGVISELIGLPPGDRDLVKGWSDDIAAGFFLVLTRDTPALVQRACDSQNELARYIKNLAVFRRRHPADDLLSGLVAAQADGSVLSEEELLATCVLLLFAGHETTTNLIANGVLALLEHPAELQRLRADSALLPSAIEELIRYDGPVQATARRATANLELHGSSIQPGEFLLLVLGAANRDPDQFQNPDGLDLGRRDNRHLGFGHGIHFCLSAPLARLEGQLATGSVLRRFPRLRLGIESPVRKPDFFLRGLSSLPVLIN